MSSMHWYTAKGKACHRIIGANGKERNTTLRDARKLNLLPSVTTVMGVADKPALNQWILNELLETTAKNPYSPFEYNPEVWKAIVLRESKQKTKKAAQLGTEIHQALDSYFTSKVIDKSLSKFISPAIMLIRDTWGLEEWISEQSFACLEEGFAGCVDLHHPKKKVIIDFKTKDKDDVKSMNQYDEHKMQLSAYQMGLKLHNAKRYNLFISTNDNTPGLCKLVECVEYERTIQMFLSLNDYWKLKNKYNPSKGEQ